MRFWTEVFTAVIRATNLFWRLGANCGVFCVHVRPPNLAEMRFDSGMFIEAVPNRGSPPALLLCESFRDEQDRAQKRTLANLGKLPGDLIDGLKALLKGGTVIGTGPDEMQIERSLPHGHVAAALGMLRKIALDRLILSTAKDAPSRRYCDLVVAMIVDRLIAPRSKLGFVRAVDEETATSSLGAVLRLGQVEGRTARLTRRWMAARAAEPDRERAGAVWLQPRSPRRPVADRLRAAVHTRRAAGRGRGVRRQHRRSGDTEFPG